MSATIMWAPVEPGTSLEGGMQSTREALERAKGHWPVTLGEQDIDLLGGMSAVERNRENPYERLIDLIMEFGPIKVWAEY